jgi:hypothetical protein
MLEDNPPQNPSATSVDETGHDRVPSDPRAGIPQEILERVITVAFGANKQSKNWKNATGPFSNLLRVLTTFEVGDKDGKCITQGKLVGSQRQVKDVLSCDLLMFDYDTGAQLTDVYDRLEKAGHWALIWTTHSHMKPSTDVREAEYTRFIKKEKIGTDVAPIDILKRYLSEVKKVERYIIDSVTGYEHEHKEGGVTYVVQHAPMPRCRVLFVLSEPFVFAKRGGTQAEAIKEWKERYAGMSEALGLAYDVKCVDPSRLMYTPRVPAGAQADETGRNGYGYWIVPGRMVDINEVPRAGRTAYADDPYMNVAADVGVRQPRADRVEVKTPWLFNFMKEHAADFRAASFFSEQYPDDVRPGGDGTKINFRCPGADMHTEGDSPDDAGFMIVDADGVTGFVMKCQHTTCSHESGEDRIWYLDRLIQHYGIERDDLLLYCPEYEAQQQEAKQEADTLAQMLAALNPKSSPKEIDTVLDLLAAQKPTRTARSAALQQIADAVHGKHPGDVMRELRAAYKEAEARAAANGNGDDGSAFAPIPDSGADCNTIWDHWPASERTRVLSERIEAQNANEPTLFRRMSDGNPCRLVHGENGLALKDISSREGWSFQIGERVLFKRYNADKGTEQEISIPEWAITHMKGGGYEMLPLIDRIAYVPVFAPDGSLITEPGYHPSLRMYLDTRGTQFKPLPDVITDADVQAAFTLVYEATRDFPFSDAFDGAELLPVRDGAKDKNGNPWPTYERGMSSRAHMIAMLMQPFVRPMVVGPCPAYFIDKSAPGTGAGLLMDVLAYTFTGHSAPVQTLQKGSHVEDEFRKRVTSMLRSGADIVFFDNINFDVDSGTLAAALTAGRWRDRILGRSEDTELPIRCVWTLAGNNVGFSRELVRRLVPIRMDAATPDPANDRPVSYYVHYPLNGWLLANRVDLIHACHVLVANWVARGCVPYTDAALQSFEGWSSVVGGILRDAGIPGFLSNLAAFNAARNEDVHAGGEMIARLLAAFDDARWGAMEAVRIISGNPVEGVAAFTTIGIDVSDEARAAKAFGGWLTQNVGRTFKLDDRLYKLVKGGSSSAPYRLLRDNGNGRADAATG